MKKASHAVTLKGIRDIVTSELKEVRYELKTLREDMDCGFQKINTKLDDVVIHALDMKRMLNSHTEMIGSLAIDLEEVKLGRPYAKKS